MKAMLVIQAKDGYAVAPYTGEVPADFIGGMTVSEKILHSYSDCIAKAMEEYFKTPDPTPLREAA